MLSGIGLILSGLAFVIVVVRPGSFSSFTRTYPEGPHDERLTAAIRDVIQDPSVADQFHRRMTEWVEGEQFRLMQERLAAYVKSDEFHERLITSFREVQVASKDRR